MSFPRMAFLFLLGVVCGLGAAQAVDDLNEGRQAAAQRADLNRRVESAENTLIRLAYRVNELESRRGKR